MGAGGGGISIQRVVQRGYSKLAAVEKYVISYFSCGKPEFKKHRSLPHQIAPFMGGIIV